MTQLTPGRFRSETLLRQLAQQAGSELAEASAETVAQWAAATFPGHLAVACSMAGDTVVAHLLARFAPGLDVLFLDTGYHFPETLGTRRELARTIAADIIDVRPAQTVAQQDLSYGPELYQRDASLCCRLRKVEPINARLATYEAWVTGLRRDDGPSRARIRPVEWDDHHRMVKINPLAAWSFDDLLAYAQQHQVPVNPLLTQGYPSIGCAPCTRAVAPGEDPRAGRWAGLLKTECGLHP
jgi:phosphoadenosine phosphosulfate reductase